MPSRLRFSLLIFASVLSAQTLLENDQVRVLKAVDRPHVKTSPHEHKVNRVMIYLNDGRQEFVSDGKKSVSQWKAGQAAWSSAAGTHTAEVISEQPLTIIEVELKKPGNSASKITTPLDPFKVEPRRYKLDFENDQVRVFRTRVGPKEKVAMHEHQRNRVVVCLTDQDETMTAADGKAEHVVHKPGDVSWGGPMKHREENLGSNTVEAIVVELKN